LFQNSFAIYFNEARTNSSHSRKHRYYADVKQDQLKTWNQLIVSVKNDNEFSMYLNGHKLKTGSKNTSEPEAWGNNPLLIGYKRSGDQRSLDNIRIYDRALSEAEVTELYELEKPEDVAPPPPSEYKIIEGQFTWHEAKADAEARGGHLAAITSEAEWQRVLTLVGTEEMKRAQWLGGYANDAGVWTWITGESWNFDNWASAEGEPNRGTGGAEKYPAIWRKNKDSKWHDAAENYLQPYLLEIPQVDLESGLVAYYPFNGNANDESGNGNDGTVNGATLVEDRFGETDKAYNFDGDDYIKVLDNEILRPKHITISTWVYLPENGQGNTY
jgi:hypothetical protein